MTTYIDTMKTCLKDLLNELPDHIQERYEITDLLNGYCSFMEVFRELIADFKVHEIYQQWYRRYVNKENSEEICCLFADIFECVQFRLSIEAFCETIESIMNNHCGKGSYLRTVNFNMEIFLKGNFGPTYLSEKLMQ